MRYVTPMPTARTRGFTLMEFMVTLVVVGVLVGLAVPNIRDFARNNRLSTAANEMLRSLQTARSEAIKRQLGGVQSVIFCASSDPTATTPTCGYAGTPFRGWIVFHDINGDWQVDGGETVLEAHNLLDSSLTIKNDNSSIVSYTLTGFSSQFPPGGLTQTSNIIICDDRGNQAVGATDSTARALTIDQTGRGRVTRTKATIDNAITNNSALTCP